MTDITNRSTRAQSPTDSTACDGCAPMRARRDFLRTLAGSAAGALLALGAAPAVARALEVHFSGAGVRGGEVVSYPVPAGDGATIDTANEIIMVRWENYAYAFALSCPHQSTGLKWNTDDHRFQCPKHKSLYQPDGTFIEGRATRGMDRFAIRRDGDKIVVDVDKVFEQDKDTAAWTAARVALS